MEVTTTPWFIDAWAVYDGVAFASRSAPEIRRTDLMTEAETTVFLSVPDLEPIPLGRITTGLRAARASFQDGFFDPDGTELAFDSLDGIRETVRRAYLATGLGPGGIAVPARPEPGPAKPAPGVQHFIEAVPDTAAEDEPPLDLVRRLLAEGPTPLRHAVRAYAKAVLLDWEAAIPHPLPETEDALAEFYLELTAAGIWWSGRDRASFVGDHGLTLGSRYFEYRRADPEMAGARRHSGSWLIAVAPCPALPSTPVFSRLSDPLKLSLCDSRYLDRGGLWKATQLLLAAILVGVNRDGPAGFWHGADQVLDHRIREAMDWLERQLPRADLPEAADRLLNDFARQWLEGRPDLPGSFPAPDPSGGPSTDPAGAALRTPSLVEDPTGRYWSYEVRMPDDVQGHEAGETLDQMEPPTLSAGE
ncbi:hypothetical protein EV643_11582 [Kribbella sp. VKM Ac-2527]|uniref:Uncharacterized protein n=1 Tax=Kribbella caucasensis TaxID=2512215 RepID=A0A4R6K5P0_9ACTN|nr:hypothetical protein [Kribbella sp. VKM Ac-2527]TDO44582.1 hypothetical protein EV643_11582 [Kribbella sp. VKM Ac-2527]